MNIYVLNKNLERVGVIDGYASIIWTNRYYSYGDFELYLQATPQIIVLLQEDFYLIREGKENNAMIIESIQITTDAENGNYLTVKGRCLKSIIYRRVIWEQTSLSGKIETCISRLLTENAINPTIADRKISNFTIGSMVETGATMDAQYTGTNLGEAISAICQNYGVGWDVQLDLQNKDFLFVLYSGTDRSYNQKEVPWVVFSNDYENLLNTSYTYDKSKYANVAQVAGEGEGAARRLYTVGTAADLERYELYVDARDLSSNDGELTDAEYTAQLEERGLEKLAEQTDAQNFDGETVDYTYKYGKDYFLGDIVEVVNEYDMQASTRVIEVIESEDDSGVYTVPTFSSYISPYSNSEEVEA